MNYIRRAEERGRANFGWLDSKHSFSFGQYHDPDHMGISTLRVINDDTVAPGAGFDTHGHQDMEIISYVLEGAMRHKDSMGHQFVVPAGEVQRMSAGAGVMHSEYNDSDTDPVHFLQIWITPNRLGIEPGYEQKLIEQSRQLTPLVTADGRDGSLTMQQDASLYRLVLSDAENIELGDSQPSYIHLIEGELEIGGIRLGPGDGYGFVAEERLTVNALHATEALFFELPGS